MILLDQPFDSFEELSSLTSRWDIDFRQLSSEYSKSSIFQAKTDLLLLSNVEFGCIVEHRGATPDGMLTFALPYPGCPEFNWFGHTVNDSNLLIFPRHGENYAFSRAGFKAMTISFPESELIKLFEDNEINNISQHLKSCEVVKQVQKEYLDVLRTLLLELEHSLKDVEHSETRLSFENTIQTQIIQTLFDIIVECKIIPQHINQRHFRLLNQFIGYIDERYDEQIRLKELYLEAQVSGRTIQNLFRKSTGLSPKSYITGKKLYQVHRELWHTKNAEQSITDIIANAGFWHMGQFAADYSKLFGELPSETVRRKNHLDSNLVSHLRDTSAHQV
jgi:AraC family ethanolamine operon transcriptional activator